MTDDDNKASAKRFCPFIKDLARLAEIGREITVRIDKLDKIGAKAVDHVDSIDHLLAEAEKLCGTSEAFEAFKDRYCPKLGQSRAYELLAIKEGRKSLEEIRAATRARVAKHRAAKRDVTESDSVTLNGQPVNVDKLGPAAQAQIAKTLEGTPEASAEKRDAMLTSEADEALAAYKQAWLEHCLPHAQKILAGDFEYAQAHYTNAYFSIHMSHAQEWMEAQIKKIQSRLHSGRGSGGRQH